jgi:hypothetical protein
MYVLACLARTSEQINPSSYTSEEINRSKCHANLIAIRVRRILSGSACLPCRRRWVSCTRARFLPNKLHRFATVVAGEVARSVCTVSGWEITTHQLLEKAGGPQPAVPQLNGGTLHRLLETAGEPRPASIPQLHSGTLHRLPQTAYFLWNLTHWWN